VLVHIAAVGLARYKVGVSALGGRARTNRAWPTVTDSVLVRYAFEDCELDTDVFELRRAGEPVKIEPQVFDVLVHLVRHRDRVVTKEELLDEVWGDRFVSESALTSRVKDARHALGDDGQRQRCIRTVHGRGYRFVAPTHEMTDGPDDTVAASGGARDDERDEVAAVAADAASPIRYIRSDALNIAYQITGSGDVDLVMVAGFVSHLTLDWTERRHAHFLRRLGTFSRLIRFDKRGTGMSDRPAALADLETRMRDVAAVMDAARSERAVLFGYSEGGPMSILYAASYPERVHGLVIYSSYARRLWAPDYPWGSRPEDRARYAEQLEQDWAWEADMRHMCPNADEELARWWGKRCRAATSPGAARALIEMNSLVDVRDALGAVQAPTLVLHRRDDVDARVEEGRYLAEHIPGARFIELEGTDHFIAVDPDQILDPVQEFVGALGSSSSTDSSLTTLLAVHFEESIDVAWVRGILRGVLDEYRGVPAIAEQAMVLATFDGPGRAVRCGLALAERAAAANLHLSVGLHTAEISRRGAYISGEGVVVAQTVADRAPAGAVWVTSTLRDLTAGSGLSFDGREQLDVPSLDRRMELAAAH
jgi:DNA-binding winged helix-turn-helix (wHTH) protein/pimeloyl-ACP methyl ester carboxylesterase